jgi:hypothetical protein
MEVLSAKRWIIYAVLCLLLPLSLLWLPRLHTPEPTAPPREKPQANPFSVTKPLPSSRNPWTLAEARQALKRQPDDAYLQYVVLQLARQEGRLDDVIDDVPVFASRREDGSVDLFGLFGSTHALQQSLQLESVLAGHTPHGKRPAGPALKLPLAPRPHLPGAGTGPLWELSHALAEKAVPTAGKSGPPVPLGQLTAPDVPGRPWKELLAKSKKKAPQVSALSKCVPDDFYLAEFRSLERLVATLDAGKTWAAFLWTQAAHDATDRHVRIRLQEQLAFDPGPALQQLVDQVAVTGSDPFLGEGSDVTLVLQLKPEAVGAFRLRSEQALTRAATRPGAARTTGLYMAVDYVAVTSPDRLTSVYAATLVKQRLHVRSNSPAGLRRVIEAILGMTESGQPVRRLGDTDEFKYVRTVFPAGDNEEDGFIYFPERFVRRLLGPEVQIAEARRLIGYTHLRMIGHAAQLYRTQSGKAPTSLEELSRSDSVPGEFNKGALASPFPGGKYSLSADGTAGVCSVLGTADFLKPCLELPPATATAAEAEGYREFVKEFERTGRGWITPVAVRLHVAPKYVRAEAFLPAAQDNPVHAALARALGGEPEPLDPLPVPKRDVATISVRLNKQALAKERLAGLAPRQLAGISGLGGALASALPAPFPARVPWYGALVAAAEAPGLTSRPALADWGVDPARLKTFLERGIGNQAGLHFYDAAVTFDLGLPALVTDVLASARAGELGELGLLYELGFFAGTLSTPAYLAIPVKDVQVVDDFLAHVDAALAARVPTWRDHLFGTQLQGEFYHLATKGNVAARSLGLRAGPARYRVFWARIGDGLYIANQPAILDDLHTAYRARLKAPSAEHGPTAHAMLKLRPTNWSLALPGFQLGWEESHREACQRNLAMLSAAARAFSFTPPVSTAALDQADRQRLVLKYAAKLHGCDFACPDGGRYVLSEDGKSFSCTVHGSADQPRQPEAPLPTSAAGALTGNLTDLTIALTFAPDGLHAVLTISRR